MCVCYSSFDFTCALPETSSFHIFQCDKHYLCWSVFASSVFQPSHLLCTICDPDWFSVLCDQKRFSNYLLCYNKILPRNICVPTLWPADKKFWLQGCNWKYALLQILTISCLAKGRLRWRQVHCEKGLKPKKKIIIIILLMPRKSWGEDWFIVFWQATMMIIYIMINIDHDFVDAEKESRWGVVYSILTSHNDNHQYNDYHGSLFCWCRERRRR